MKTKTHVPFSQIQDDANASVTTLPWFEGFHVGQHTDRHGKTHTFSQEDIDQMVANFEPGKVPFVISHPDAKAPAYGYGAQVKSTKDGQLYLTGEQVDVGFAKSVVTGAYGQRSLGLRRDKQKGWYIDHVAFLGAQAPALNLKPVGTYDFSDVDNPDPVIEFDFSIEIDTANVLTRFLSKLRDTLLATEGEEKADKIVDRWEIDWLNRALAKAELDNQGGAHLFNKPTEEPDVTITQEQLDAAIKKAQQDTETKLQADFSAQLETEKNRADAAEQKLKDEQTKADFAARLADCKAKVDQKVTDGVLTPAQANGLAEFMANLPAGDAGNFEFSAADGKTVTQDGFEFAKAFVDGLGKTKSPLGDDQDPVPGVSSNDDLDKQATEYARENNVSYVEAVNIVASQAKA